MLLAEVQNKNLIAKNFCRPKRIYWKIEQFIRFRIKTTPSSIVSRERNWSIKKSDRQQNVKRDFLLSISFLFEYMLPSSSWCNSGNRTVTFRLFIQALLDTIITCQKKIESLESQNDNHIFLQQNLSQGYLAFCSNSESPH